MAAAFDISDVNATEVSAAVGDVAFGNDFIINRQPGGIDGAVRQAFTLGALALGAWVIVRWLKK